MNKIDNHLPTKELQALDAAHHMHPFTGNSELAEKGVRVITQARGAFITDSEGVDILDAMAGLWCVNIGYGRKELADAASAQMQQLPYYNTFFQTSHPPVIALSARLADLAPAHINNVFFAGSGSEANDTNIRLVRHYWALKGKPSKKTIISRHNAYHGSSMGSASLGGMQGMHAQGGMPIPDITHIAQPYWYGEGEGMSRDEFGLKCARAMEDEIDRLGEDNVGAFIGEPVQGAGAVIVPPATYWPEIQRICKERNILLIADEVICGFGRTGNWFGCETFGIKADIMTIAKGLSSGYMPIGGSMVSDEVAAVIGGDEFNHGYTYSGHPVACAVALENLRILDEEKIVDYVRDDIGPYLQEKWRSLADHPIVGEARIVGMMGAIELTPDKANRAAFASDKGTVGLICREHCFANNVIIRHVGDAMIISPPLTITRGEVDLLIERATKALDATLAQLEKQGLMKAA
jgi:putrescine aminotransferase